MGANNKPYPPEQIEYLREIYPTNGLNKSTEMFNEVFGYHTRSQIRHRVNKFGIKSNYDGKFQKNRIPWNAGISYEEYPGMKDRYKGSSKYWFKKGELPANTLPVGTEREFNGAVFLKVAMPDKWESKCRYVYEQHYGVKLQKGDKILHGDGNFRNNEIDNLILIDDAMMVQLNKNGFKYIDADLTRGEIYRRKLISKIKELENGNENKL